MPADPTAASVAALLGGVLHGPDLALTGVAAIADADAERLAFVGDPQQYASELAAALSKGAVVLFPASAPIPATTAGAVVAVDNPRAGFALAVREFFAPRVEAGIAASAVVHPTATVAPTAHIGEFTVIGEHAVVGEFAEIRHHVVVARGVEIGAHCVVKSHAVIGEEGLGLEPDAHGNNVRLPHLGSVIIDHHAEIGSHTTVCAGTITPTRVGAYAMVDDNVHLAHNVQIGANAIITGSVELAGSVVLGERAWIGPNATVRQGLTIGANALVGMAAVVTKSVPEGETVFGNPARRMVAPPPAQ